ncbi:MAG: Fe-S cluster assembly protein SufD [Bacteroidetes bacterium]|nr:Fe-S cluster assembly protein SufD [Bacteroidota bacterium]
MSSTPSPPIADPVPAKSPALDGQSQEDQRAPSYREQMLQQLAQRQSVAPVALPFFQERRDLALAAFERQGFPDRRHEEWKYTPVSRLTRRALRVFSPAAPAASGASTAPAESARPSKSTTQSSTWSKWLPDFDANRLVFVNGMFDRQASQILDQGAFSIGSLAQAMVEQPDTVATWFDALAAPDWSAFAQLNTALHQDGAWIHVQPGVAVPHPILILDIAENLQADEVLFPRHLLVAEQGSSVRVLHHSLKAEDQASRMFSVVETFVERNASVVLDTVQDGGRAADCIHHISVRQDRDSRFTARTFCLQGDLIRNDLRVRFAGENAECHLNGFYLAAGQDVVDNHLLIDHAVPHCQSNQLYKGIATDQGNAVFNGKIFVRPNAQKTNAYQSNKNLLLSAEATINTKPQLEIFADDVKCSHGATSGQLNPESVFYLQARGILEETAKTLLLQAFAAEVATELPEDAFREYVSQRLFERIRQVLPGADAQTS